MRETNLTKDEIIIARSLGLYERALRHIAKGYLRTNNVHEYVDYAETILKSGELIAQEIETEFKKGRIRTIKYN